MKTLIIALLVVFSTGCTSVEKPIDRVALAEACMRYYLRDWIDYSGSPNFVTFCDFSQIGVRSEEVKQRVIGGFIIKDASLIARDEQGRVWDRELKMNGEIVVLKELKQLSDSTAEITLVFGGAPTYGGRMTYILKRRGRRWAVESEKLDRVAQQKTTEPNQRLQTMRFKLPMNSIAQGPHV